MKLLIACEDSVCSLLPQAGGSIGNWRVKGQEMFRSALDLTDPLMSASFPLVPYSNRIADARFEWLGNVVHLSSDTLSPPHAIHGVGWRSGWYVCNHSADHATLKLDHMPNEHWPWAFEAEQHVVTGSDYLTVTMKARNLCDQPTPLAFGHHPYFESRGASLAFKAKGFLPTSERHLPGAETPIPDEYDFETGRYVERVELDNQFTDWSGTGEIRWHGKPLALRIESDLSHAVVYVPAEAEFFCFEPVPHITNALNGELNDMPVVAPGESFSATIRFMAFPMVG